MLSEPTSTPRRSLVHHHRPRLYWRTQLFTILISVMTLLPAAARADSFTVNVVSFCSFCNGGTLNIDHDSVNEFFFNHDQNVGTINSLMVVGLEGSLNYSVDTIPTSIWTADDVNGTGRLEGTLLVSIEAIAPAAYRIIIDEHRLNPGTQATSTPRVAVEMFHESGGPPIGAPIPEPSTLLLFGTGMVVMLLYVWRRERVQPS